MAGSRRSKKKIYLVNRDLQLRYTRLGMLVGLISTILTGFIILYPLYKFEIIRVIKFVPWPIMSIMAMAVLCNTVMIGALGIVVTHKIAGPLYSLLRQIRRIKLRQFNSHLQLRGGDELKFIVRNFNEMVDDLQLMTLEDQDYINRASRSLEEGDSASAQQILLDMKEKLASRMVS